MGSLRSPPPIPPSVTRYFFVQDILLFVAYTLSKTRSQGVWGMYPSARRGARGYGGCIPQQDAEPGGYGGCIPHHSVERREFEGTFRFPLFSTSRIYIA